MSDKQFNKMKFHINKICFGACDNKAPQNRPVRGSDF